MANKKENAFNDLVFVFWIQFGANLINRQFSSNSIGGFPIIARRHDDF